MKVAAWQRKSWLLARSGDPVMCSCRFKHYQSWYAKILTPEMASPGNFRKHGQEFSFGRKVLAHDSLNMPH
jgi:hypothetical protein